MRRQLIALTPNWAAGRGRTPSEGRRKRKDAKFVVFHQALLTVWRMGNAFISHIKASHRVAPIRVIAVLSNTNHLLLSAKSPE